MGNTIDPSRRPSSPKPASASSGPAPKTDASPNAPDTGNKAAPPKPARDAYTAGIAQGRVPGAVPPPSARPPSAGSDLPEDPLVRGNYTVSRAIRSTPPAPVEHNGKKWDVAEVVMKNGEPHVRLQPAGVHPRYLSMQEVLQGRIVKYKNENYRLVTVRKTQVDGKEQDALILAPINKDQLESEPLRSPLPVRKSFEKVPLDDTQERVPMSAADQVTFTFNTGQANNEDHVYTLSAIRYGSFLLTPATQPKPVDVPLKELGKVEVRLNGRELEGVYTLEATEGGGLEATQVDPSGNRTTDSVEAGGVAPRYVMVPAPDFSREKKGAQEGHDAFVGLDAFYYREAQVRATALRNPTEGSKPISDPLIGTLPATVRSHMDHGSDSLRHLQALLEDPHSKGPVVLFNVDLGTDTNDKAAGNPQVRSVLEALFAYRSRNPDAPMRIVSDERMWFNRTANQELTQRLQDANIELVFPQVTAKPRINHSKGAIVGDRVLLTTAAVVPKTAGKIDVTTELPPEAAGLYREYLAQTFKTESFTHPDQARPEPFTHADKEKLAALVADLAQRGVVVNDPMTKSPIAARAIDGLIDGARQSIRFTGSELKDVDTTQKLIERAADGLQVLIQHRGLSPESKRLLDAAQREHPNLKVEDMSKWEPYPHFNAVFADDRQAYVGTAYLWPNQLLMAHHGLSHENGVVLGSDAVKDLLRQLSDAEAKVRPPKADGARPETK